MIKIWSCLFDLIVVLLCLQKFVLVKCKLGLKFTNSMLAKSKIFASREKLSPRNQITLNLM